ncbi:MAG: type II secretion protein F, partial [Actinomycetota bacterium]
MSGVTDAAMAILLGGILAAGILCILAAAPRWGAASLTTRIAPYVRDAVDDAALPSGILPKAGVLPLRTGSMWERLKDMFARSLGGGNALALRLAQAGTDEAPASFRARQLGWAVTGFGVGCILVVILALTGRMTPPAAVLPLLVAAAGAIVV